MDIPYGWATVIAAVITAVFGGLLLRSNRRAEKAVAAVHDQVANNHKDENGDPILMRDDLDEKFEGLADLVKGVAATQEAQKLDIGGLRAEIRQVRTDQTEDRKEVREAAVTAAAAAKTAAKATADAIRALERTRPHKRS
jgi:hypothetical protein